MFNLQETTSLLNSMMSDDVQENQVISEKITADDSIDDDCTNEDEGFPHTPTTIVVINQVKMRTIKQRPLK